MKNLVICMPGKLFSDRFLQSYSSLLDGLFKNDWSVNVRLMNVADIVLARNNLVHRKGQKIFDGYDYDYSLWIDSDQVFEYAHFEMLLDMDKDISSALIKINDETLATDNPTYNSGYYNQDSLKKMGIIPKIREVYLKEINEPFEVTYCGFGFVLIKKGVFEKIKMPYFNKIPYVGFNDEPGECGEDLSFCIRALENGFKIWVNPLCRVLHEKSFTF